MTCKNLQLVVHSDKASRCDELQIQKQKKRKSFLFNLIVKQKK